jgi:DNA-binding CsgD family transcriptional regulator
MGDLHRRVLALLEPLHATPGRREGWLPFLDAFQAAISPDALVSFASQHREAQPGVLACSGLGVRHLRMHPFLAPSRPHPSAAEVPVGSVVDLAAGALDETPLFRELAATAGAMPGPGLLVALERSDEAITSVMLVVPRGPSWQPTAEDRSLLVRLAPHVVLARRLHVRLTEGLRNVEALLSAFERLAVGVVLLSAEGRVSYLNRSAADSLGLAAGFDDPASEGHDGRTLAWRRLLGAERECARAGMVLPHPEDGRPLQLVSMPFAASEGLGRRFARAVFVGDPKRRSGDPLGILGERFGLTPGERRLTLLLLSDCSLDEAARLLGIARSTSQSVLKRVFAKTGARRQSDLVRLILTGFAQVRPEAPPATSRRMRAGDR